MVSTIDSQTAATLQRAMGAAQTGNLVQAGVIAREALAAGGDAVALNAFLGMVTARSGDLTGAVGHLSEAHRRRPGDATIACNLIAALLDLGEKERALEIATWERAQSDPSLRIARYRGFAAQQLERYPDAVEAYEYVVDRVPDDFESWNNLGNARSGAGDFEGSVAALERAARLNPHAAPTRINLAGALRSANRPEDAEAELVKASRDFPDDAQPEFERYANAKRDGNLDKALAAIEEAARRDPKDANLHLKLAVEYGFHKRSEEAEKAYRSAISLDPSLIDAHIGLLIQYEHLNRQEEFPAVIAMAKANEIEPGALAFMQAMEHRREGRFEEALASVDQVPDGLEPQLSAHLRATVLDRLQRPVEAFAEFEAVNAIHIESPAKPLERARELRDELRAEIEVMTPAWRDSWCAENPPQDRSTPVFLVGFPRSGTTLLDTILMGHPQTAVMEEQPPLNFVSRELGNLATIAGLDDKGIRAARARYFDEVAKVEPELGDRMLIDKSPLFLHKAALIHRLFPNAKFILALRHPCDVLLSCYMSNFRLNSAMSNFLRLKDAAEFYDLTFRHWERAVDLLPLEIHTVRYEDLVEDVGGVMQPVFDFLGLPWNDEVLDHQKTARARGLITTASYAQVVEPIYKRSSGRWLRYREQLAPVLPVVAPWAERFGYAL